MRTLALKAAMSAIACRTVAYYLCGAILPIVAFGQVHGQSAGDIGGDVPAPWQPDLPAGPAPNDNAQAPLVFAKFSPNLVRTSQPRELSLANRVAYQYAIEEVYWRHRIWPKENARPKPTLDEVMSSAQVRQEVEDYLRNSQVLTEQWQQPITPEQLQCEMERMASHTKQPEVLRELFAALDNDPAIIAGCLARTVLTERLVRELSSRDERGGEQPLEGKRGAYPIAAELKKIAAHKIENGEVPEIVDEVSGGYTLPEIEGNCTDDTWVATTTANAPSNRYGHTAVWTGTEMIVWGGTGGVTTVNTGSRYNPATDSWDATTVTNAPGVSVNHTAVWTGVEMIVWGGANGNYLNTGGRYNPSTNSWIATTVTNAPGVRFMHTAVWTGGEMIVWGGYGNTGETNTGGRYNPSTDSWIATTTTNAPSVRQRHTAVWTGSQMIVWGGSPFTNTGGRYDPITNSWIATTLTNAPVPRTEHAAVWTGTEMIVWGGAASGSDADVLNTGGRYNPNTDSWNVTAVSNAPAMRRDHTAVWTGSEMIVWAGYSDNFLNTGGRYSPLTDSWVAMAVNNVPAGRTSHSAIWTGSEMVIWGGSNSSLEQNTGGRYCAQPPPTPTPCPACTPTPTPTPTSTPTPTATPTSTPTAFAFVPGHYYTSNYFSLVITEYDSTGTVVGSYTVPSELGEEVRGLAFGADGLLYATLSRGSSGSAVLALESDGNVAASYAGSAYVDGNLSSGKIALDNLYLYVSDGGQLTRFLLGDPSSGTVIYGGEGMFDVKPLPNGHLFVAMKYWVDEITTSGAFVRRIELTGGGFDDRFGDIRGLEYNPATNILFVTHLGGSGFSFRIIRLNATTGALLNSVEFNYADDMFLDASGNLLVGSTNQIPRFYSQDLAQGNSLNGGQQAFVTQYAPAQALNISTRMRVETGSNVLIGGFIVTGAAPKNVAVRGIGPSLAQFGIPDVLADPTLELHDSSGALVQQNDNWQDDPSQASQLTALGLALENPNESGIVASLSPSAYTAILAGKNGGTGVGLVEIYDTNPGANSQLANISTRGFVLTGSNLMIGGFILGGANNTHVAVRGIGPSLAKHGLSPVLADPTLELRDSNGALLVSNDNWQDDPVSASQLTALGLAPANAAESGILVSLLPPGAFTAILAGKNGGTGIGLVEIYNVH